ncbi:putative reverse transcriptase domain-containing protein [Tanacetum coccineum]
MDKKICTFAERQTKNKRKQDDNHQQPQQQQTRGRTLADPTLQDLVSRSHTGDLNPYALNVTIKCNRVGHLAHDYRSTANANTANNQRGTGAARNGNAPAKVYAVDRTGTNPDSNVVMGTFLLNNCYASVLFDTGADRSFVSTAFSSQIDITPTALDHYYDVELADGRIIGLNTILRGCTLNFPNHPFTIDLMPVVLGSFDAIIGMDWLAKYQAIIVCAEKIIRIP